MAAEESPIGAETGPLLQVEGLHVDFSPRGDESTLSAVRGVSYTIERAEIHAIVGESGSGKTVSALALMGLLDRRGARVSGRARFEGHDLLGLDERGFRSVRGSRIAMIFQEPRKYLDPSMRIGPQIYETLALHRGIRGMAAREAARELLSQVGLADSARILRALPEELSGGMCQRIMIAQAIASRPSLLIADEPTTALDANRRSDIEVLIRRLASELGMAVLFISHDLRSVAAIADRVSVMYAGKIVESGPIADFRVRSLHPYTRALKEAIPQASRRHETLRSIPGSVPDPTRQELGCSFAPRCPIAQARCLEEEPVLRKLGQSLAACHFAETP